MISVTDLIIRIKNGYLAKKEEVNTPSSQMRCAVLEKLVTEGYISSFEISEEGVKKMIAIKLLYTNGRSALTNVKVISKPGQKSYVKAGDIPSVLNGLGTSVISTTKGIMTGKEARKAGLGGELLFTIW